jgi:hypothetical protein
MFKSRVRVTQALGEATAGQMDDGGISAVNSPGVAAEPISRSCGEKPVSRKGGVTMSSLF